MHPSKLIVCAFLVALPACKVGDSRTLDTRRDLSGLDVAYLESKTPEFHDEDLENAGAEMIGAPFWFAPVVGLSFRMANAEYRGSVKLVGGGEGEESDAETVGSRSGYSYEEYGVLGLGLMASADGATWDAEGSLQSRWESRTVGWGLLYQGEVKQDGQGVRRTSEFLGGLLGYLESEDRGYLEILWIPLPFFRL